MDLGKLSAAELSELSKQARKKEAEIKQAQREAYEGIRSEVAKAIKERLDALTITTHCFRDFLINETRAFYEVMKEYSKLSASGQDSFSIIDGGFKIEVRFNKVKGFDERADAAAARLIEYLRKWINTAEGGEKNPIYKLAMMLLERNKEGELDYKSISKLYELEMEFADDEYSSIMSLFRESNVIENTKYYYNFFEKTAVGGWRKIEPSFNRL